MEFTADRFAQHTVSPSRLRIGTGETKIGQAKAKKQTELVAPRHPAVAVA